MQSEKKLKILYLSRSYPNNVFKTNGLWVEGLVHAMSRLHHVKVIAPVPYAPPFFASSSLYAKYRNILTHDQSHGVEIYRPRYLSPPGYWLHGYIGEIIYRCIVNKIDRYRKQFPFDLIHAHFSYPEGYIAARLAKRYKVPLVITEHASWIPWMDDYPRVRKQAVWATQISSSVIVGSNYLKATVSSFINEPGKLSSIPIGVDCHLFRLAETATDKQNKQILYVGRIHRTKGVDVLLESMRILTGRLTDIKLVLVGGDLGFRNFQLQEEKLRNLATELGIDNYVEFVGSKSPSKVAEYMQKSSLLVLPSRRESFGAVLIEALACGIPVVATRCGGPEDFVNEKVGALVEKENPEALATGIEKVLRQQDNYSPEELHQYAREGYSWGSVAERINEVYQRALSE